MENDDWICCNCGIVTLDRYGRCPICRTDNVAPFRGPGISSPPGIDQRRAEEAEHKAQVHVVSPSRAPSQPERVSKAG